MFIRAKVAYSYIFAKILGGDPCTSSNLMHITYLNTHTCTWNHKHTNMKKRAQTSTSTQWRGTVVAGTVVSFELGLSQGP